MHTHTQPVYGLVQLTWQLLELPLMRPEQTMLSRKEVGVGVLADPVISDGLVQALQSVEVVIYVTVHGCRTNTILGIR